MIKYLYIHTQLFEHKRMQILDFAILELSTIYFVMMTKWCYVGKKIRILQTNHEFEIWK